jgi:tetratricopeptide (TPR) repeat protein
MACSRWDELNFVKYCQNEFRQPERVEIEQHLGQCSECQERFALCLKVILTECTPEDEKAIFELLNSNSWQELKKELVRKYASFSKKRTHNGKVILKVAAMLLLVLAPIGITYRLMLSHFNEREYIATVTDTDLPDDPITINDLEIIARTFERSNHRLRSKPNDLDALFTRAVSNEKLFFFEQAQADYQRYLYLNPGSSRHLDVKHRLDRLTRDISNSTLPAKTSYELLDSKIDDYLSALAVNNESEAGTAINDAIGIANQMKTQTGEMFGVDIVSYYRSMPLGRVEPLLEARKHLAEIRSIAAYDQYLELLEKAIKTKSIFEHYSSQCDLEQINIHITKYLIKLTRSNEAQIIINENLKRAVDSKHLFSQAQFLAWQGENFSNSSNFPDAIRSLESAGEVAKNLGVSQFTSVVSMLLSSIYSVTNNNESAFEKAHRTIKLSIEAKIPVPIQTLEMIGLSTFNLEYPTLAEQYMRKAVELSIKQNSKSHLIMTRAYMGILQAEQRKFIESEHWFQESFKTIELISDANTRASIEFLVTGYYARSQMLAGNSKDAIDLYKKALDLGLKANIQEKLILSQMHQGLGECLMAQGDLIASKSELKLAVSLNNSVDKSEQINTLLTFAVSKISCNDQIRQINQLLAID